MNTKKSRETVSLYTKSIREKPKTRAEEGREAGKIKLSGSIIYIVVHVFFFFFFFLGEEEYFYSVSKI